MGKGKENNKAKKILGKNVHAIVTVELFPYPMPYHIWWIWYVFHMVVSISPNFHTLSSNSVQGNSTPFSEKLSRNNGERGKLDPFVVGWGAEMRWAEIRKRANEKKGGEDCALPFPFLPSFPPLMRTSFSPSHFIPASVAFLILCKGRERGSPLNLKCAAIHLLATEEKFWSVRILGENFSHKNAPFMNERSA